MEFFFGLDLVVSLDYFVGVSVGVDSGWFICFCWCSFGGFALVEHLWLKSCFFGLSLVLETSLLVDSSSVLFVGWKTG